MSESALMCRRARVGLSSPPSPYLFTCALHPRLLRHNEGRVVYPSGSRVPRSLRERADGAGACWRRRVCPVLFLGGYATLLFVLCCFSCNAVLACPACAAYLLACTCRLVSNKCCDSRGTPPSVSAGFFPVLRFFSVFSRSH